MKIENKIEKYIETERQRKLLQSLVFLLKLVAVGLVFRAVLWIYPDTTGIQVVFADLIGMILSPFMTVDVNGVYILTLKKSYIIVQDCLGWKSMAVFTGLFIASTNKYIEQLRYLIYGLIAIFAANIVRVASTIYLSEVGVISFEVIHTVLWRWGLTFIVFVLWLYWYAQVLDTESEETD